MMRLVTVLIGLLTAVGMCRADGLNIHVILSGQVAPGVYGQVRVGDEPPPPLVYARPMIIEPQSAPPPPVYLHVPPGHARNWRRHCHEYNACDRPVYFVRSAEYEPGYARRDQDRGHHGDQDRGDHGDPRDHGDHGDHDGHGHDGHGHDGDRDHPDARQRD